MVVVKRQKGESEEKLINRFRKKIIDSGHLIQVRKRDRYTKPSEARKEKKYAIAHRRELEKKRGY